jgi:hypothetical protein
MRCRGLPAAALATAAGLVSMMAAALGQTFLDKPRSDKPRVPPGIDPGGVAVAIIGSGIDYTRPEIAGRLARDGEGELIGWDFLDNDRRPWEACLPRERPRPCHLLRWPPLLGGAQVRPHVRLVPMRASWDRPQTLVQAVQAIAQSPARIVVLALDDPPPLAFVAEAALRFPRLVLLGVAMGSGSGSSGPISAGDNYHVALQPGPDHRPEPGEVVSETLALAAARCVARMPAASGKDILACAKSEPGAGPQRDAPDRR